MPSARSAQNGHLQVSSGRLPSTLRCPGRSCDPAANGWRRCCLHCHPPRQRLLAEAAAVQALPAQLPSLVERLHLMERLHLQRQPRRLALQGLAAAAAGQVSRQHELLVPRSHRRRLRPEWRSAAPAPC